MSSIQPLLAAGLLLSLTTLTAEATLTSGTADGKIVVYDSVTNITWAGDANLLGTLESTQGFSTVVNAIIAASPVITDSPNIYDTPRYSGHHTVSATDFISYNADSSYILGQTTWFGAQAFINYLNNISYAGSNQWALPSAGANPQHSFNQTGTQFGELFYNELGGTATNHIPDTSYFTNEQANAYWLGTEFYAPSTAEGAWYFNAWNGDQWSVIKNYQIYSWAVSPGNIAAVPEPGAVWLFSTGIAGLLGLRRRYNMW